MKTPRPGTAAWKRFIANAMAKAPADRTPQETVAVRVETTGSVLASLDDRVAKAREVGRLDAVDPNAENPFATDACRAAWEAGRLESLEKTK